MDRLRQIHELIWKVPPKVHYGIYVDGSTWYIRAIGDGPTRPIRTVWIRTITSPTEAIYVASVVYRFAAYLLDLYSKLEPDFAKLKGWITKLANQKVLISQADLILPFQKDVWSCATWFSCRTWRYWRIWNGAIHIRRRHFEHVCKKRGRVFVRQRRKRVEVFGQTSHMRVQDHSVAQRRKYNLNCTLRQTFGWQISPTRSTAKQKSTRAKKATVKERSKSVRGAELKESSALKALYGK